jgi:hypothetical protein
MKGSPGSAQPSPSLQTPNALSYKKSRQALLVLDGECLSPESLGLALAGCVRVAHRLDILLVNPPEAPTSMLRHLLIRLEHAGVDYRLTSVEGDLGEQVALYLKRFLGITTVLVESVAPMELRMGPTVVADMHQMGYRFLSFAELGRG